VLRVQRTEDDVPGRGRQVVPVVDVAAHHVHGVAVAGGVHGAHVQLISAVQKGYEGATPGYTSAVSNGHEHNKEQNRKVCAKTH
jgi:hypothetical protein